MALDNGLDDKSRKERRKEARLAKNKKKLDSWVERQQIGKLRKASMDSKAKDVKKIPRNRDADHSSEVHNVVENHEDELDSNTLPDFDKPKAVKRKKSLMRSEKSKFEEYLEMETHRRVLSAEEDMRLEKKLAKKLKLKDEKLRGDDDDLNVLLDGIPSIMGSLDVGKTPYAEEDGKMKRISRKKHKKSKLTEEEPESKIEDDAMTEKNDGLEQPVLLKASNIKSKPSKNPDSTASNTVKRKKTKFEQYIEMEMKGGLLFGEEDVALERKLAKKLKVKEGKLRGDDDDINMLFEGIPSTIESLEGEQNISAEEDPVEDLEHSPPLNKQKKKSSLKHKQVAELETKEAPTKVPVVEAKAKYLAPHLRSCAGKETEEHSQVRRRVRGLLNRLSESNVESITGELSTIVQSVGRSTASQIIGEEILASCSGGPRGNEQYAAVFAASVAGMSCLVGIDFGAKLLASLAKAFEAEYMKEDNLSLRNLTLLLSYLYIFGVCSSELIYDFIIMLSKRLMEVDVSTILTLLQCCGMKLRSDDPVAMKNFILSVQNRVNELKATLETGEAKTSGKRMEFMLETILDIKNNRKRPKADTVQHTRIRKWLQKLRVDDILIRGLKWSKLCDPDKKGQWWLSGDNAAATDNIEEVAGTIDRELNDAQKMLQLAAAQRMNTDARRAIFCVIMSSDDYIDAFEKLLRLDLAGKQDREIMRVLVDCCLQEKVFNKYYCVLASKLCSHDKNHKFTLQYCLWDHYKELESMQLLRSMHLSKFVAEMLSSYSLSLAVLKVVDLADITQLTPKRAMHFRMLFEAIFNYSDKLVWNIFTRIAVIPEYEGLRSGIVFFVSKYVLNSQKSLADKFKVAKKALNNAEGIIL